MSNKPKPPAKVTASAIEQRFASPMSSNEKAEKCQPTVPKCTQQTTTWAVSLQPVGAKSKPDSKEKMSS